MTYVEKKNITSEKWLIGARHHCKVFSFRITWWIQCPYWIINHILTTEMCATLYSWQQQLIIIMGQFKRLYCIPFHICVIPVVDLGWAECLVRFWKRNRHSYFLAECTYKSCLIKLLSSHQVAWYMNGNTVEFLKRSVVPSQGVTQRQTC